MSVCINAQHSLHESIGYGPTAFSPHKSEKRITNTNVVLTNFTHGITNNISYSVGGAYISDYIPQTLLRLKFTHQFTDHIRLGISPVAGYIFDNYEGGFYPDLDAILTIGKPSYFLNFSYTKSFNSKVSGYSDDISLGSSIRLSKKVWLFGEYNLAWYEDLERKSEYRSYSMMLRLAIKNNQHIQLGFYKLSEDQTALQEINSGIYVENIPPIPVLSYSLFWGKRK